MPGLRVARDWVRALYGKLSITTQDGVMTQSLSYDLSTLTDHNRYKLLISLVIVTYIPAVSLWLPSHFR